MPELSCRLVAVQPGEGIPCWRRVSDEMFPEAGDIFYAPEMLADFYRDWLSAKYWVLPEPRRAPLVVVLPGGAWHCLDQQQLHGGNFREPGWDVSGEPPIMTVAPSINIVGSWHGWLQSGVLRW